jgi:hypothetical protein
VKLRSARRVSRTEHDRRRVHEAADVVDVAVGVVSGDASSEPEHVGGAQPRPEGRLEALAPQAGVANLPPGREIALFCGEHRPAAVHVDTAPFEHEVTPADARMEQPLAEQAGRGLRDAPVLPPVAVPGPGVEVEVHDRRLGATARASLHEDRAAVARPAPVGRVQDEPPAPEVRSGHGQAAPGEPLLGPGLDQDAHLLPGSDLPHDLAVDPADRVELPGPVGGVVGPAEPGRLVGLPLGRHREAQPGRRRDACLSPVPHEAAIVAEPSGLGDRPATDTIPTRARAWSARRGAR